LLKVQLYTTGDNHRADRWLCWGSCFWRREFFLQYRLFSQQRRQWVLDKKTEEYRELLSTLTSSVERMARYSPDFGMQFPGKTSDQVRVIFVRAASKGKAVTQDRVFVADVMASLRVLDRWQLLAGERDINNALQPRLVVAIYLDKGQSVRGIKES
jgi:hypothetical protein